VGAATADEPAQTGPLPVLRAARRNGPDADLRRHALGEIGSGDGQGTAATADAAELTFIPLGEALSECSTGSAGMSSKVRGRCSGCGNLRWQSAAAQEQTPDVQDEMFPDLAVVAGSRDAYR